MISKKQFIFNSGKRGVKRRKVIKKKWDILTKQMLSKEIIVRETIGVNALKIKQTADSKTQL